MAQRDDVRLILGDALTVLREMPTVSVDVICTDPPYGQSNEKYDKGVNPEVWKECFRVAKPNAVLLSFAGNPTYHRIASGIEAAGWKVRQMWAWVYRDGMITSAYPREGFDRLAPAMDPICYATKGKVILRLKREGEAWKRTPCGSGYSERSRGKAHSYGANGRLPRSIVSDGISPFEFFVLTRTHGGRKDGATGHPNQKPLALMRWLLDKIPGEAVLDPFAGSGTTLVAAMQTGRRGLGIEISEEYFAIAQKRIADEQAKCPLFAGEEVPHAAT